MENSLLLKFLQKLTQFGALFVQFNDLEDDKFGKMDQTCFGFQVSIAK